MSTRSSIRRVLAVAAALGLALPTSGLTSHLTWTPYRTAPFTSAAGQNCSFALRGEPVRDEEEIATFARFADGSPRVQQIRGDLDVRYTNLDNGRSEIVTLDGVGTVQYFRSGATRIFFDGPAAVGFAPTDPYPAGFYRLTGFHVVDTAPERAVRRMSVDAGGEHEICRDLD